MIRVSTLAAVALLIVIPCTGTTSPDTGNEGLPRIAINDNRRPAGSRDGHVLTLRMRAAGGLWYPEGDHGPALEIEAFGELTQPLQVPSPLIRVPEGTEIVASVRNDLAHALRVHGLCSRDGTPCPPVEIAPSAERELRFTAGRAGTYHYWATTTGMPLPFRAVADTQLSGAFIVDPADTSGAADRVLVITDWTSLTRAELAALPNADDVTRAFFALNPRFAFMINGLAWPATERLTYPLGERVRWRVVNLSSQAHPMHLHGFYFSVDALGDGLRDSASQPHRKQQAVTQLLNPGGTMEMTWTPEREGNWLFHCHIAEHIRAERRLAASAGTNGEHHAHDSSAGMAGLVLGVTVTGKSGAAAITDRSTVSRKLTLTVRSEPGRDGAHPPLGFTVTERAGDTPLDSPIPVPGPTIVLQRGQPVEITVANRLAEATAIHWHGIELESYFDGVHGWSGIGSRVTPLIEPGGTFPVRFTPPRTGTFIYHTHLHDDRQLTSGMYGALIVVEPGETFDPARDHVVVIGRSGSGLDAPVVMNGSREPLLVWKAGMRHRVRLINITPDDILVTSLGKADSTVQWVPLTKDGAPVPAGDGHPRAATQTIAVGETYDFEYEAPPGRHSLWLNVRTPGGKWGVQGKVVIK
jgi:FtsP/CotA-like multicopper oxidase with cupredoxin domain